MNLINRLNPVRVVHSVTGMNTVFATLFTLIICFGIAIGIVEGHTAESAASAVPPEAYEDLTSLINDPVDAIIVTMIAVPLLGFVDFTARLWYHTLSWMPSPVVAATAYTLLLLPLVSVGALVAEATYQLYKERVPGVLGR